ncbi:MAG: hypothetical protein L6R45_21875 [Anaerolineae bacterium]|nr:hypothetical protein [Anaerolineae bacterium]
MKYLELGEKWPEKRLVKIISDFSQNPTSSVIHAAGTSAAGVSASPKTLFDRGAVGDGANPIGKVRRERVGSYHLLIHLL